MPIETRILKTIKSTPTVSAIQKIRVKNEPAIERGFLDI